MRACCGHQDARISIALRALSSVSQTNFPHLDFSLRQSAAGNLLIFAACNRKISRNFNVRIAILKIAVTIFLIIIFAWISLGDSDPEDIPEVLQNGRPRGYFSNGARSVFIYGGYYQTSLLPVASPSLFVFATNFCIIVPCRDSLSSL